MGWPRQADRLGVLDQVAPNFAAIKATLATQSDRLAALDQIQQKLQAWDPKKDLSSDPAVASMLDQARRTSIRLDNMWKQLSEHSRELATLETIYRLILDGGSSKPPQGCFDYVAAAGPVSRAGAASAGAPERYRTVEVHPVFFDRGSPSLSDWARQALSWFLSETQVHDGKLAIFGSTDPQGTATQNQGLARQRAEAIRSYVLDDAQARGAPPREIISVRSSSDAGTPEVRALQAA